MKKASTDMSVRRSGMWCSPEAIRDHLDRFGTSGKGKTKSVFKQPCNTAIIPKHNRHVVQASPDIRCHIECRRKTAAFEEWRQKLNSDDRLPRGKFFKGKRPDRKPVIMDEF